MGDITVKIKVLDKDEKFIKYAVAKMDKVDKTEGYSADVGSKGYVIFNYVSAGSYTIKATRKNYQTNTMSVKISSGLSYLFEITLLKYKISFTSDIIFN